jgi:hypothetical protein
MFSPFDQSTLHRTDTKSQYRRQHARDPGQNPYPMSESTSHWHWIQPLRPTTYPTSPQSSGQSNGAHSAWWTATVWKRIHDQWNPVKKCDKNVSHKINTYKILRTLTVFTPDPIIACSTGAVKDVDAVSTLTAMLTWIRGAVVNIYTQVGGQCDF